MIVARIDNDITARTPNRRGRSFKGLLDYLLKGPRNAPNADRVAYAETANIWADLPEAAYEMARTWQDRFARMNGAGCLPRNGADNRAPVYHIVMSWRPDEDPPEPDEMAAHAKHLLALLGLAEHEAALVVHNDTANPHIHIVANTVHPWLGRTAQLRFDKRIMQDYAARYEERRAKVVCEGRFTPDAADEFNNAAGRTNSRRRRSRGSWQRAHEEMREVTRELVPDLVFGELTRHHATFTPIELAKAVTASTSTPEAFSELMAAVMTSPELVRLDDPAIGTRYTTRSQQAAEQRLSESAARLAGSIKHPVSAIRREKASSGFAGADQAGTRDALTHLLDERGLSVVVGYAGAGKSTLLKSAADAWLASGYRPRGLALAGRAAEGLEADAGIPSGTIAGFLIGLDNGTVKLAARDILVIDEAGMVASRQMDRVLFAAREAGAKVVLVGDPEQLQAIEAGGPFRYIVDHYDHARLTTVWRQKSDWMREATRNLAEGWTEAALSAYEAAGMVLAHDTKGGAIDSILDMWLANRERGLSQLILTATNADAGMINAAARARLRFMGALGDDVTFETEDGAAAFAIGDRIMFRRNDKILGVKNGTTGTVREIAGTRLAVVTDGRPPCQVAFDVSEYPHVIHGYAVTIHKSQGATVDRCYVLAAPNMDRHSAYVALTRHRDRVSLHWSRDAIPDRPTLTRRLSRVRQKDVTLDYREAIAAGIHTASIRAPSETSQDHAETSLWAQLYDTQRAETVAYAAMRPVRRAFWMAANAGRFIRAAALTLEKLHERERVAFARAIHEPRRDRARWAKPTIASDILMAAPTKSKLGPQRTPNRSHAPRRPG